VYGWQNQENYQSKNDITYSQETAKTSSISYMPAILFMGTKI
jgi:hypothetical protein